MTYTLQGIAGQRYGELTPEEQAQVQGAGQAHVSKIRSTLQPTWSQAHTNELLSGAERDAQEIAQRTAEGIFTAKSDAMRLAERAKETGQVTIGNASTIPNIQAQGQAKLQGAVPLGSAADMLQKGLAAGTVSPTSPEQQFAASMQGSNVNAPGIVPSAPSPDINAKYAQALQQTQATGQPAPPDGGTARQVVQGALPPTPQVNPVLDNLFVEDKNIANFSKMVQDYLSPQTQQQTLKQEYEALTKAQGIEGMKTELMNMKNVIEGAEDDIRTEITKAGGFATDSQVLALTNARNKTLIKNYNNLLQTKQQAEEYISNMMGFSQTDKQMAQQRLDSQMNLSVKLVEMEQNMQKNARDTMQNVVDTIGYDGLFAGTQNNPFYQQLAEQTLGLAPGGLTQLAQFAQVERTKKEQKELLDLDLKSAQIAKLESEIAQSEDPNSLDNRYKQTQIEKMKFEMQGVVPETINIPGVGIVNGSAAALSQEYMSTGKLPSAADLKAAGTTFGEISRIAKESPKFEGAIVDKNTNVKPAGVSAAAQEDFARLYNITKMAEELAALDKERVGGVIAGTLGKIFGSDDQSAYLTKRKAIVDEISRMQSGAALTADEVAFYQDYLPGRFSESFFLGQDSGNKIQNFANELNSKLQNRLANNNLSIYGYSKVKVGGQEFEVGDVISNGTQQGRVNPDGTITEINNQQSNASTRANRNNNPLNIKASPTTQKFSGVVGVDNKPASDGGKFLTFNSPEAGFEAAKKLITSDNYKNLSVDAALKRWSNSGYGGEIVPDLKKKTIAQLSSSELSKLIKTMARQEGYTG